MDSKVKVLKNEDGSVLNISENNPDYAWVLLQQVRTVVDDNGFLRRKPVSALIPGYVSELQETGFFAGQQLDGKIIVEESLEPFNDKTPERDLKIAGETGVVCTLGGLPIFRRTKFSFDANGADTLIKHDNVEQLRAAYSAQNAKSAALQPNDDFSIGG